MAITDRVPDIVEFVTHKAFLGLGISPHQETLLRAIYGLPLRGAEQEDIWAECTGRQRYPGTAFAEVTVIAGARSGKDSRIAAPIVVYEAYYGGHEGAKGEVPVIPLVAQDGPAAHIAFGYVSEYIRASAILARRVEDEKKSELRLTDVWGHPIRISCFACSAKSVRGWSIPVAVMDEVAYFRTESGAVVDVAMQRAIRRGMVAFATSRLVKISTPSLKQGVLYDDFEAHFGKDGSRALVWKARTTAMNPSITEARLSEDRALDPSAARTEYDAEFANETEGFLPWHWLEQATMLGRHEVGPDLGRRYIAAVDPSGGGTDAFTLAIVHAELDEVTGLQCPVQDVVRAWAGSRRATVDLAGVVAEIAAILRRYGIYAVIGDKYAGDWPKQEFAKHGVSYTKAEVDKSRSYIECEPLFAQRRIQLLDDEAMLTEFRLLEKRYKLGGKTPTIDHPRGGHDDRANATALAIAKLAESFHAAIDIGDGGLVLRRGMGISGLTTADQAALDGGITRRSRPGSGGFWGERGGVGFWGRR